MTKWLKIVLITLLIVLVIFAALAETVLDPDAIARLDLPLYLRLVALLGVFILFFFALGYRHKIISSQKYRRAQEVVSQAESEARRKQRFLAQQREKLETEYKTKEQALEEQLHQMKNNYTEKMAKLKEQNMQLKETVASLMKVVKNKKNSVPTKD